MKNIFYTVSSLCLVAITVIIFTNSKRVSPESDEYYRQAFLNNVKTFSPFIPDSLAFCGETVPLDQYNVYERLDRELMVNVYWQSNIMLLLKRANRYFPVIEPILKEYGVPDDFKYLALAESGFLNVTSPANARGFWQFLKPTAQRYKLEVNNEIDERCNLEKSTVAACQYLKSNYDLLASWTLAAAAYNAGENAMKRHIDHQKVNDYYNLHLADETMRYVFRILALKMICEDPQSYGIILRTKDLYPEIPVNVITVDTTVTNLFDFAVQQGTTYQMLKMHNPWLRSNHLPNKSRKVYEIKIPLKSSLSRYNLIEDDDDENILLEIDN